MPVLKNLGFVTGLVSGIGSGLSDLAPPLVAVVNSLLTTDPGTTSRNGLRIIRSCLVAQRLRTEELTVSAWPLGPYPRDPHVHACGTASMLQKSELLGQWAVALQLQLGTARPSFPPAMHVRGAVLGLNGAHLGALFPADGEAQSDSGATMMEPVSDSGGQTP